jgi:GMP synthase-like glutamine amidotransferase
MRAHIFQHIPFEGPGNIQPWLVEAGYEITFTHFFSTGVIPAVKEVDFLVIMGGSMSVNDEYKHPWLIKEKQFIREMIAEGKPVLGICLGSQMIASALGAKVNPNPEKEIGWFPVTGLKQAQFSNFQFPVSFTPLHWHGETFDLPQGSILLAGSEACKNQAFQVGKNVIAMQFHPEATQEILQDFVLNFKKELVPARYVQSEEEIISVFHENFLEMEGLVDRILKYLCCNRRENCSNGRGNCSDD